MKATTTTGSPNPTQWHSMSHITTGTLEGNRTLVGRLSHQREHGPAMETTEYVLRSMFILSDLPEQALADMARVAVPRTYVAGELAIVEGESCQAVYFISAGHMRAYRLSFSGREQVLERLGPGESFNTVSPFQQRSANYANVEALTPVSVYVITRDDFVRFAGEWPELTMAILRDLAQRIGQLIDLVEDLSMHTVRGRLARFLMERAEEGEVTRRWTQHEIAAHVGTVRTVVGRTLRAFDDEGLTRMERQRIVLLDRAGLQAAAES